jgi:hypothetical protein
VSSETFSLCVVDQSGKIVREAIGRWRRHRAAASAAVVEHRVVEIVEREAKAIFHDAAEKSVLIVDDAQSLRDGKFRRELLLLSDLIRRRGW